MKKKKITPKIISSQKQNPCGIPSQIFNFNLNKMKSFFRKYLKPIPFHSLSPSYDYIIIGAGTAGSLLANRLTSNPKNKVLLIESGSSDDYFWINIPLGYLMTIGNKKTDWCIDTVTEPNLANRSLACPRGKAIGGSSSINGMIYIRGQKEDYDEWGRVCGSEEWKWENMLKCYKKIENYIPFNENSEEDRLFHAKNGPIRVERSRAEWEALDLWREAAEDVLKMPKIDDLNKGVNFGTSYFNVTQNNGFRFSAADAFLHTIANRKNLDVVIESTVGKIIIDEKEARAKGVEIHSRNKQKINVYARKETILSAGSMNSPLILQLSGIGPRNLLEKHGIPVIKDLPSGDNLHDHLQIRPTFKLSKIKTLNILSRNYYQCLKMGLNYVFLRSGPIAMAPSTLGAFVFSNPKLRRPNLQWHIQPLSLEKFGEPLDNYNAITTSVCNIRPSSRGWVRITGNSMENPELRVNYLNTEEDRKIAIDSLKITRKIMQSNVFAKYEPEETRPGKNVQTDEEILEAAKMLGRGGHHIVGSCKMGKKDDKDAVVDSELNVIGIKGLRVVDSSIMPNITSGNTNAPTYAIAEKGAELILRNRESS